MCFVSEFFLTYSCIFQVVSNDEDWHSVDYEQASQEKSHYAISAWGGSSANHPSVLLLMITMILLASFFSSQVRNPE